MPARGRFWNQEIETLPREELEVLQIVKLRRQIRYCYDSSPFYRQRFAEAGAEPGDIKEWADYRRLPIFLTRGRTARGKANPTSSSFRNGPGGSRLKRLWNTMAPGRTRTSCAS